MKNLPLNKLYLYYVCKSSMFTQRVYDEWNTALTFSPHLFKSAKTNLFWGRLENCHKPNLWGLTFYLYSYLQPRTVAINRQDWRRRIQTQVYFNLLSFNPKTDKFLFVSINFSSYHLQLLALKLRTRSWLLHFPSRKGNIFLIGFFWVYIIWSSSQSTTRIYPFPILTWEDNWILKLVKWTLRRHQQIRDLGERKLCQEEILR